MAGRALQYVSETLREFGRTQIIYHLDDLPGGIPSSGSDDSDLGSFPLRLRLNSLNLSVPA